MPSLQARAPNSPVIIVGTHLDLITKKKYPVNYLPDLQQLIYDKYMDHMEPEKSGLPRVIGRIEVSCKGRLMFNSHIDELVNMIWSIVLEEPQPCESCVSVCTSVRPSVRPSMCLSVCSFVQLSYCPFSDLSVCPSSHLSVHPAIRLFIQSSVCLSSHLSVCPSIQSSVCPSSHMSVHPAICLSNQPRVQPFVCVSALS